MPPWLALLAAYLGLGVLAGFMNGLIGIGGGFVLVPGLYYLFVHAGVWPGNEMPLVLGTTMACIIFTSLSSARSHHAHGAVRGDIVRRLLPYAAAGTALGAYLATVLDAGWVKAGFAAFCLYTAVRILFFSSTLGQPGASMERANVRLAGGFFGTVCGLIGIGGSSLLVPYMLKRNLEIRAAMATTSVLQVPIGIAGTTAYLFYGWGNPIPMALGYIYLPALVCLVSASMLSAPLGVRLAHRLPVGVLKKLFGLAAAVVGLKMAGGVGALAILWNDLLRLLAGH